MSIETDILGVQDLLKSLDNFPKNIQKNILVGATRAAAKPIVDEARQKVPIDTANLKKSIGILKKRTKDNSMVWFTVSPRKKGKYDGWYAHMVEFGTSKMSAQPFMRPTFENQSNKSIDTAKTYLAKRIDKETLKARV